MGTWNAFCVKAKGDEAIAEIRDHFPHAEVESSPKYIGVRLPDEDFKAPVRTPVPPRQ